MERKEYFFVTITASINKHGNLATGGGFVVSPSVFVSNGYCRLPTTTTI